MTACPDLLVDLERMLLTRHEWEAVGADLAALDPAGPDETRLSQIVFEARVRQRFHAGRAASTLPPTKQTSALPWVGLACGGLLLVVGGLLGGGLVLAGIVALSIGVLVVAVAGSRVAHRQSDVSDAEQQDPPVPIPDAVAAVVARLRST